jgi:hypothetical protein
MEVKRLSVPLLPMGRQISCIQKRLTVRRSLRNVQDGDMHVSVQQKAYVFGKSRNKICTDCSSALQSSTPLCTTSLANKHGSESAKTSGIEYFVFIES